MVALLVKGLMEENKQKKPAKINTKLIPPFITLLAAFISCVFSISQHASNTTFIIRLLIVVVVFLVFSTIIKMILDYAFAVMEEKNVDDGTVLGDGEENQNLENISALMADDDEDEE